MRLKIKIDMMRYRNTNRNHLHKTFHDSRTAVTLRSSHPASQRGVSGNVVFWMVKKGGGSHTRMISSCKLGEK
ncbi:hypothetical protein OUZ56_002262 [Daphnia magna]|uniref:Uncharacterized protein n=1 Tax=Daphnia magna TaxID=35525 RepID=A0ABR0A535_9CRUS|nr:hypothetical protein OUZ56_002262 [Daphnia magna]